MKKQLIIDISCYLIIILFTYAALSKLFLFEVYLYDLNRSPFINLFAPILSIVIPMAELILSVLLIFEKTRKKALLGSFVLMTFFTIYVASILLFTTSRPCTCGGLIKELSWPQHFALNLFFMMMSVLAFYFQKNKVQDLDRQVRSEGKLA